ncbi:hypothetical protein AVEN_108994-1 [Araneus ventricosus]|uniref:Uncharacterized protein n=1 Tax=Araneus ventricosus TaxID=182803 RepID=A0A4Y2SIB1_ARAVE|nr:hypothetical protein AVEN_108994-1 [Araneus ventricosus]
MSVDRVERLKNWWGDYKRVSCPPVSRGRVGDGLQVAFLRVLDDKDEDQSQVVICRREPSMVSSRSGPQPNARKRHAHRKPKKAHVESLTYLELYSRRKALVDISWRHAPAHSWYRCEGPGAAIRFKGVRKDQTALARLTSGH